MLHGSASASSVALTLLLVGLAGCDETKPKTQEAAKEPAAAASATSASTASAVAAAPAPSAAPSAEPSAEPSAAQVAEAPSGSAAAAATPAAPGAAATQAKVAAAQAPDATATASAAPAVAAAPTGPVVGKPWQLSTAVQADPGYKCNDEYPHKFTTSGGTNVSYPDPKPRGACAGKGVAVTIPFIPTAAGPGTIKGTFSYGICDEKKTSCLMKKQEISLPFVAAAN
jgi:hypothetical protein